MIYYIYKLVCNDVSVNDFYIGSTSNIRNRKYKHKSDCNNQNKKNYMTKIYQTIRENGNWENWRMVILEEMEEGTTLLQSRMREEYYRLELQSTLNMVCCGTGLTREEYIKKYQETNKENRKEYMKEYIKEYQQTEKYKENKKEYMKEYSQTNKDKKKEYDKEYYQKNKDKILEKQK